MIDRLNVLFLDDNKHRHKRFFEMNSDSKRKHVWEADECLEALRSDETYDIIFLDHDLDERTNNIMVDDEKDGRYVTKMMTEPDIMDKYGGTRVIIHSLSTLGAAAMREILEGAGYTNIHIHPFVWEAHIQSHLDSWT